MAALNLCDIEQKARDVVEQARAEAKRILQDAVTKAREVERLAVARGEKAGFDAGMAQGTEQGRKEAFEAETQRVQQATETVREAMMEIVNEVEGRRHEVLADAKQGLLRLSIAIAERICRAQVCRTTDHLQPLVEEVIDAAGEAHGLVLRVNPADADAVETFIGDVHALATAGETAAVRILPDEAVSRGGCLAERRTGKADARVETQIERIVNELLGVQTNEDAADTGESE
jgi:flagellar assembly protein FliH